MFNTYVHRIENNIVIITKGISPILVECRVKFPKDK